MKCPFCHDPENRVVDSRLTEDGGVIRRRRECASCKRRFTTYERVEETLPTIVKKDGGREAYDRHKIEAGMRKACEKRPVSITAIEEAIDGIERGLQERGDKEVPSSVVGEAVMQALHALDPVAYVRFASVYRSFKDVGEFMRELEDLMKARRKTASSPRPRRKA
ncbi:transcriptional regulator NrdR [Candidatus Binatia bacterium]|nr:transcriptional regulator NrdR [Candidatus Binatia bacterium]